MIQYRILFDLPKLHGIKFADLGKELGMKMVYWIFNHSITPAKEVIPNEF